MVCFPLNQNSKLRLLIISIRWIFQILIFQVLKELFEQMQHNYLHECIYIYGLYSLSGVNNGFDQVQQQQKTITKQLKILE